jgi:gamma-glutamylcyclotransferase (GGCT)/AIG2-like uncharacterized protein YtfP
MNPPASGVAPLVFVYGTLKRGGSNQHYLAGQTLVGPATLRAGHALYSLGDYPGLVADPRENGAVTGEIWRVSPEALAALDELEGLREGLYARVPAPLATRPAGLSDQEATGVQMYVYLRNVTGRPRLDGTWPVGPEKGSIS